MPEIATAEHLHAAIVAALAKSGLSQKALAERCGMDPANLSGILSGRRITLDAANRIAAALNQRITFRLSPRNGVSS